MLGVYLIGLSCLWSLNDACSCKCGVHVAADVRGRYGMAVEHHDGPAASSEHQKPALASGPKGAFQGQVLKQAL